MAELLRKIFDWSEVWALFIPLTVLLIYKPKSIWVVPVKWYLIIALTLNICIDFIWYVNMYDLFDSRKGDRWNNNIFYNFQSIVRLFFFSWFFSTQGKQFKQITRIIPVIFLTGTFIFFALSGKSIFIISSYLMATEAGFLLIYCLWFTNKTIRDDKPAFYTTHPPLWVVGGLTLYTAVNFFIFLFYNYLMYHSQKLKEYAASVWDIHNILFILLCTSIAIAFYNERTRK